MDDTNRPMAARYTSSQLVAAMRQLTRERGSGWARDLSRAEYLAAIESALVARYGER